MPLVRIENIDGRKIIVDGENRTEVTIQRAECSEGHKEIVKVFYEPGKHFLAEMVGDHLIYKR